MVVKLVVSVMMVLMIWILFQDFDMTKQFILS